MFNQRGLSKWAFGVWLRLRRQHWGGDGSVMAVYSPDRFSVSYVTFGTPGQSMARFANGKPVDAEKTITFHRFLRP